MSFTMLGSVADDKLSYDNKKLSLLDVRVFLRGCVVSLFGTGTPIRDEDTIRERVAHSDVFAAFIETHYPAIVSLFSDDYFLLLNLIFMHRGKEIEDISEEELVANYAYYKNQLLNKMDQRELAGEMLLLTGDLGGSWRDPFPCLGTVDVVSIKGNRTGTAGAL